MKKIFSIIFILTFLGGYLLLTGLDTKDICVLDVTTPLEIALEDGNKIQLSEVDCFDAHFSEKNRSLAQNLGISEEEAFVLGNLAQYWSANLLKGRKVKPFEDDLVYYHYSYKARFENTAFCLRNGKPTNQAAFNRQLNSIRKAKYVVLDFDNDTYYNLHDPKVRSIKHFLVMRKGHVKKILPNFEQKKTFSKTPVCPPLSILLGNIKILVSDSTTKLKPDRNCGSEICKEILSNINSSKKSIDIAIYGYSSTPAIENAILSAQARGVEIRLVYDSDAKGENIYPDTDKFANMIPNRKSDFGTKEARQTMHNKFYIFDDSTVITGSANLSHTDMSGFNSNSIIVIKSEQVAKIYKREFEQMYNGKFHSEKIPFEREDLGNMQVYFSPQDRAITNGILPLINSAKNYIYIPTFIITEKRVVTALIDAKTRGVDVKIIVDALNASNKYSKHSELRLAGIPVKAENYAGKMHSKSVIIDDEYLVIGSMNLSKSGELKNDENLVILKNAQATKFYRDFFLYQWNKIPNKWLKYTPRAEGKDSIGSCSDGIDNNYDGLTDQFDAACKQL